MMTVDELKEMIWECVRHPNSCRGNLNEVEEALHAIDEFVESLLQPTPIDIYVRSKL